MSYSQKSDRPSLIPKPKPMMRRAFSPNVLATHWGRNDRIWARVPSKLQQSDPNITWTGFFKNKRGELHMCGAKCGVILGGERFV